MERQVVGLLCRTSDRAAAGAAGTRELADRLGARIIGSPGEPRTAGWADDLRDGRGCLLEAGGQLDDAFADGRMPILLAAECSIAVSTLPVLVARHPDARVLWIDAHADYHTPDTTRSGYLGGMCLAGACGLWDTGFGAGLEPPRVVMHGVREVEGGERVGLDRGGVHIVNDPAQLAGFEVFVHLDLDVLDPTVLPAQFGVDGGLEPDELRAFLAETCEACTLLGAEITSAAPGHAELLAEHDRPVAGVVAVPIHRAAATGFARSADAYDRGRPGYPDDAVGWLAGSSATASSSTSPPGRGCSRRALVARGLTWWRSSRSPRCGRSSPARRACSTGPPRRYRSGRRAGAVTVAQAFHWFDGPRALAEIHRVLAPGGVLAVLFNRRRMQDEIHRAIQDLLAPYRGETPAHASDAWRAAVDGCELFEPSPRRRFTTRSRWTPTGLPTGSGR